MHSQSNRKRAPKGGDITAMPTPRERRNKLGKVTSYQVWTPVRYVDGINVGHKPLGAKTVEELRRKWVKLFEDVEEGTARSSSEITTFGDFADWYLADILTTKVLAGEKSPATLTNYKAVIRNHLKHKDYGCAFLRLGGKGRPDQQLNLENLEAWTRRMIKCGVPVPTQTSCIKVVHAIGEAMKSNPSRSGMRVNPAKHLDYPSGASKTRKGVRQHKTNLSVTMRMVDASQSVLPPHMAALWPVATGLGLRGGELCGLQWADIHDDHVEIVRQVQQLEGEYFVRRVKNDDGDSETLVRVPLPQDVAEVLRKQKAAQNELRLSMGSRWGQRQARPGHQTERQPGDWVFTEDGLMTLPSTLKNRFAKLRTAAGAEHMTLHRGRHDYITVQVNAGVPPSEVSRNARHKDKQTLFKYYLHDVEGQDEGAAAIQAMFEALRTRREAQAV